VFFACRRRGRRRARGGARIVRPIAAPSSRGRAGLQTGVGLPSRRLSARDSRTLCRRRQGGLRRPQETASGALGLIPALLRPRPFGCARRLSCRWLAVRGLGRDAASASAAPFRPFARLGIFGWRAVRSGAHDVAADAGRQISIQNRRRRLGGSAPASSGRVAASSGTAAESASGARGGGEFRSARGGFEPKADGLDLRRGKIIGQIRGEPPRLRHRQFVRSALKTPPARAKPPPAPKPRFPPELRAAPFQRPPLSLPSDAASIASPSPSIASGAGTTATGASASAEEAASAECGRKRLPSPPLAIRARYWWTLPEFDDIAERAQDGREIFARAAGE